MSKSVAAAKAERAPALEAAGSRVSDLIELTKPRITGMVLVTNLVGGVLASGRRLDAALLLQAMVGTGLVTGGAQALNQFLERKTDALMHRTQNRPLPAGRVQPWEALAFGSTLAAAGVATLALAANTLTALLSLVALFSYLFLYTPLKKKTPLSTLVGAVPGAIPPVMGWTAIRGQIDPGAVTLFAILFTWQVPHFMAICSMYREDYARAGFPMIPVLDPVGARTARYTVGWSLALVAASLLPGVLGMAGVLYVAGALALGLVFLYFAAGLARSRTPSRARLVLLSSVVYLPGLMALMLIDRIPPR